MMDLFVVSAELNSAQSVNCSKCLIFEQTCELLCVKFSLFSVIVLHRSSIQLSCSLCYCALLCFICFLMEMLLLQPFPKDCTCFFIIGVQQSAHRRSVCVYVCVFRERRDLSVYTSMLQYIPVV